MGDRSNIVLFDTINPNARQGTPEPRIFLYRHWAGSETPKRLQEALAFGTERWGDEAYLARIITSRIFRDLVDSETGGGIGTTKIMGEHPLIVVNLRDSLVFFTDEGAAALEYSSLFNRRLAPVMTFEEFLAVDNPSYPEA